VRSRCEQAVEQKACRLTQRNGRRQTSLLHMALFSGYAVKADDKGFSFSEGFLCLGDVSVIIERLQVLASPIAGLLAFFFGFSLLFITILRVIKLEPRG